MPHAVYVTPDGDRKKVEIPVGTSLMTAAVNEGIRSIVGDCGGGGACATCHIYVDPEYQARLAPMDENERDMLDCATAEVLDNSRLSCQVPMTDDLDGIEVVVAPTQW